MDREITSVRMPKQLRDRLGTRVRWKQSLADVIEDLLQQVEQLEGSSSEMEVVLAESQTEDGENTETAGTSIPSIVRTKPGLLRSTMVWNGATLVVR